MTAPSPENGFQSSFKSERLRAFTFGVPGSVRLQELDSNQNGVSNEVFDKTDQVCTAPQEVACGERGQKDLRSQGSVRNLMCCSARWIPGCSSQFKAILVKRSATSVRIFGLSASRVSISAANANRRDWDRSVVEKSGGSFGEMVCKVFVSFGLKMKVMIGGRCGQGISHRPIWTHVRGVVNGPLLEGTSE